MKFIFSILTSLFLLFNFLAFPVSAQINSINPLNPGETCGNPTSTNVSARKCCYYQPQRVENYIKKPGIPVVDSLVDTLRNTIDDTIGRTLNPINELITSTVKPCFDGVPTTPGDIGNASCTCVIPTVSPLDNIKPLCNNIDRSKGSGEYNSCLACLSGASGKVGVWTGVGCVYTDVRTFIQETIFGWGIGLAGGLALLCIIYAAFQMQSSQGNPEKLKKAQEMLTSCVMGLMLIIFSVFILRLIGVNILRIPGLV